MASLANGPLRLQRVACLRRRDNGIGTERAKLFDAPCDGRALAAIDRIRFEFKDHGTECTQGKCRIQRAHPINAAKVLRWRQRDCETEPGERNSSQLSCRRRASNSSLFSSCRQRRVGASLQRNRVEIHCTRFKPFGGARNYRLTRWFVSKSFIDHGHNVDLYTFDPALVVPNRVALRDASTLIEHNQLFTYQNGAGKGSPAAFANLFRYLLLATKGGWWIDTDVICLSSEIPKVREFYAWQNESYINAAILYFEPDHTAMRRCLARTREIGAAVQWGETGPVLLTSVLADLGATDRAQPASRYPVPFQQALDVLRPSLAADVCDRTKGAWFLHLWNEIFRRQGIRKYCLPPRGSLLRELCDRHAVSGWTGEYGTSRLWRGSLTSQPSTNGSRRSFRAPLRKLPNCAAICSRVGKSMTDWRRRSQR